MDITFERLQDIIIESNSWMTKNPDESPFKSNILKFGKQANKIVQKQMQPLSDAIEDLKTDYAFIIENKAYKLTKDGNRMQSPETEKAFNEKKREFTNKFLETANDTLVAVNPCICTVVPDNLTAEQKELFAGILI